MRPLGVLPKGGDPLRTTVELRPVLALFQTLIQRRPREREKDPMRAPEVIRARAYGGTWRHRSVEVVIQIFLSDSQRGLSYYFMNQLKVGISTEP
jgi:hypothetical protein